MQSQLPAAWSQIRVENDLSENVLVSTNKQKKRKHGVTANEPAKVVDDVAKELETNGLSDVGNCSAPSVLKPDNKMVKKLTSREQTVVSLLHCVRACVGEKLVQNSNLAPSKNRFRWMFLKTDSIRMHSIGFQRYQTPNTIM